MTDTAASRHPTDYPLLALPHIHLHGPVDAAMYTNFRGQLANAPADGPLVVSLTTLGGDPEMARAMGDDLRLLRDYTGRETLFLGKVSVYSAGATFMSSFPADKRFLTRGTRLMLHERQMTSQLALAGPLRAVVAVVQGKLHELEASIAIEEEGFRDLVAGSRISFEELQKKAVDNWYMEAEEARDLGLVLDVI